MKKMTSTSSILIVFLIIALTFSGCADITKSGNYNVYKLKYLVNLTDISEDTHEETLDNLKEFLSSRLNKFNIANVNVAEESEEGLNYIALEFGTIDDINEIKNYLEKNEPFNLKKKIEPSENYAEEIENKAGETLQKLLDGDGAHFELTAQNEVLSDPERIIYSEADWMYRDEIKEVFAEKLFEMEPGTIYNELIKYEETPFALAPPIQIVSILKLFNKDEVERVTQHKKEVEVSHILIAYEGAMRAAEDITRTKEEAKTFAEELKQKLSNGADFVQSAYEYSNDDTNKNTGGVLGTPAGKGIYVEPFEIAALKLEEEGEISEIIESPFGFHIIKAGKIIPDSEESHMEERVRFAVIFYAVRPSEWEDTSLTHEYLEKVETIYTEEYDPFLIVTFNTDGKQLLEEITDTNHDNVLGIFTGKILITSFTVKKTNKSGELNILKPSTTKEADDLKDTITMEPLPASIILMDETKIESEII